MFTKKQCEKKLYNRAKQPHGKNNKKKERKSKNEKKILINILVDTRKPKLQTQRWVHVAVS